VHPQLVPSGGNVVALMESKSVNAKVENGTVFVSRTKLGLPLTPRKGDFGGSDWISLAEAVKQRAIEINR
jgi:hypothetical protein